MNAAWAAVIALALTALDGLMTTIWVSEHYAIEGNPILDSLINRYGIGGAMVMRVVFGSVLVAGLYMLARNHPSAAYGLWAVATVLTALVVWHAVGIWTVVVA